MHLVGPRQIRSSAPEHNALDASVQESVKLAAEYGGQLGAYADGVRAAKDYENVRAFVHLPLAGRVVEVNRRIVPVVRGSETVSET